jgi:2-isopropylmalate synthase
MTRDRLYLYDTTLRDGQQTQGVQFSTQDKLRIAAMLDDLGVDYIEGGWPGANPTDSAFFEAVPETRATMAAFGMTKRAGRSAANDDVLAGVMNAGTAAVCLVGTGRPPATKARAKGTAWARSSITKTGIMGAWAARPRANFD